MEVDRAGGVVDNDGEDVGYQDDMAEAGGVCGSRVPWWRREWRCGEASGP